ncbi:hormogonium polysaccharide secretion pseudopilin HpsC [Microcoleus sp. AR_TQ3_B6]|uniref:hormogonium polysaccharide secretion pseudopilin HpsC n=1 Tax=Microcoleus sp. AR_TQ3_B6 TaxID=3055284 RepID=UPI002FCF0AF7
MKSLLRLLLKSQHQRNRLESAQTEKGMTLIELLVGSIMAFLIITPMLAFVVDMLNTDRREQVKSNTEQDIQAAVDFIAQDLSQAIYIYDNRTLNGPPGPNEQQVRPQLPSPPPNTEGTPILVFWKRQQLKNSLPINPSVAGTIKPKDCNDNPGNCNDTYVLSLVAYYQIKDNNNPTWCQPAGNPCPTRIVRYEIRDGIDRVIDPSVPGGITIYGDGGTIPAQRKDPAFNTRFNLNNPTVNVTDPAGLGNPQSGAQQPQVLVNYIDHSPYVPAPTGEECRILLGFVPPAVTPAGTPAFAPDHLLITDRTSTPTHSFYACVDTSKNIARVTIRGNSLRRIQTDANYAPNKSAYFPTASVQVQGLGARGK